MLAGLIALEILLAVANPTLFSGWTAFSISESVRFYEKRWVTLNLFWQFHGLIIVASLLLRYEIDKVA